MRRTAVLLIAALQVGGCEKTPSFGPPVEASAAAPTLPIEASQSPAATEPVEAPKIALDGEGLRLIASTGTTRLLAFGVARPLVEMAVKAALGGEAKRSEFGECGAGPMQFTKFGGLTLNFQQDKFLGWTAGGDTRLATMDGIGPGRKRSEVEASRIVKLVPESTLGAEFSLGDPEQDAIGGFFKGSGAATQVDSLYAGLTCFFR